MIAVAPSPTAAPPSADDLPWLSLEADEEVVWAGGPTLLGYLWAFVAGALLVPVFGVGLAVVAWAYLRATNTAYVVTTASVYKKTGVLSRTVTEIGHEKIQDTSYRQSAVGRFAGFGTVELSTAGGSGVEMRLAYVPDPLEVQSRLDEYAVAPGRDERGRSGGRTDRASGHLDEDALATLVEEVRATREALEAVEDHLDRE